MLIDNDEATNFGQCRPSFLHSFVLHGLGELSERPVIRRSYVVPSFLFYFIFYFKDEYKLVGAFVQLPSDHVGLLPLRRHLID